MGRQVRIGRGIPLGGLDAVHDRHLHVEEDDIERMFAQNGDSRVAVIGGFILSSPLVRAHDTAKIAAKALKYRYQILLRDELLPEAPAAEILTYLRRFKEAANVLIVGHEPLLGTIASALLGSATTAIEFKKGALCCISTPKLPSDTPGTLLWHLTPKQLRMLASA